MLKYHEFIKESISIHKGDFEVTSNMVSNGKMIEKMIPREVTGNFDCNKLKLTTLEGSPETVGGSFACYYNKLVSLEGSPETVGAYFDCENNKLTSLEGSPNEVSGSFQCYTNQLTTLEGSPGIVGGDFYCSNNLLSSLKGGPETVRGSIYCENNKLVSLEYGPKNFKRLIKVDNGLETEKGFIESGQYINEYWLDLLKHMISNNIELTEVSGWPKDFLTDDMIKSVKGINKFKL